MKCAFDLSHQHIWANFFETHLQDLCNKDLLRRLVPVECPTSTRAVVEGKEMLLFCTNDYLGLAYDQRMIKAAATALKKWGTGSRASRLISGNISLYTDLEAECARFKETESALVFSSGYCTNIGVISSLAGPGDVILSDQLNHASIVDACRLSKAEVFVYPHCDTQAVESLIKANKHKGKILVVTDGVFSMDGDLAPLPELVKICSRHEALLMVDDAHATGVLGPKGAGTLDHFGIHWAGIIQMGTFSKALGSLGGFVACTETISKYLVNKARSLIYTTALPPSVLAANLEALRIVKKDPNLRFHLRKLIQYLKKGIKSLGLAVPDNPTPIFPLIIGSASETIQIHKHLLENGIFVPPIRPPTVPKGKSRLRISLSASHSEQDIDRLISALADYFRKGA